MLASNENYVHLVANKVKQSEVELLLIAGDISNDYQRSLDFLHQLEQVSSCKVLFVPGNHDYWSKDNNVTDTYKIYEAFKADSTSILEKPYVINDEWAVVGNSGWYNHSFGSSQFSDEQFSEMTYKGRTWQDKIFVHWGASNQEMHQWFYNKIEKDVQAVSGRQIILMTHMVTHPHFIVPMPHELFSYFNAFIGSSEYKKMYETYNIKVSVMGHVHYRKQWIENDVKYICACLGNCNEWRTKDPVKEIDDAFFVCEI